VTLFGTYRCGSDLVGGPAPPPDPPRMPACLRFMTANAPTRIVRACVRSGLRFLDFTRGTRSTGPAAILAVVSPRSVVRYSSTSSATRHCSRYASAAYLVANTLRSARCVSSGPRTHRSLRKLHVAGGRSATHMGRLRGRSALRGVTYFAGSVTPTRVPTVLILRISWAITLTPVHCYRTCGCHR